MYHKRHLLVAGEGRLHLRCRRGRGTHIDGYLDVIAPDAKGLAAFFVAIRRQQWVAGRAPVPKVTVVGPPANNQGDWKSSVRVPVCCGCYWLFHS